QSISMGRKLNSMRFTATEVGFQDGLGGASNSTSSDPYHYILFGRQTVPVPGTYFEFDDQINGSVDGVTRIAIGSDLVQFDLKDCEIAVVRGTFDAKWDEFVRGIRDAFPSSIIAELHPD